MELFGVNLGLEKFRLAQFHEFVGVARVTILASEFAAAIGIDGTYETHPGVGIASDEPARFQFKVLNSLLGLKNLARLGKPGDSHQPRGSVIIEQHICPALDSPFLRHLSSVSSWRT